MEIPTAVLAVLFLMGTLCSQTCLAYHECFSFMCPHSLAMAGSTLTRCLRPSKERAPEGSQGLLFGANTPTACCFLYISRQIPCKFVNDYYETSSQCYKPGIIFQTKRGRQVCADPSETWVQEYISELEMNA